MHDGTKLWRDLKIVEGSHQPQWPFPSRFSTGRSFSTRERRTSLIRFVGDTDAIGPRIVLLPPKFRSRGSDSLQPTDHESASLKFKFKREARGAHPSRTTPFLREGMIVGRVLNSGVPKRTSARALLVCVKACAIWCASS